MPLLFDTQLLLWLLFSSDMLPVDALRLIEESSEELFFSTTSVWEVAIKFSKRPDIFRKHPKSFRDDLLESGFQEVTLTTEHVIETVKLPMFHRDPFDRILIAQAGVEGMQLVTADALLTQYNPDVLFVG